MTGNPGDQGHKHPRYGSEPWCATSLCLSLIFALSACAGSGARQDDFVEVPGIGATRIDVPRPSTGDGNRCTVSLVPGESVSARAAALREIGLFAERSNLSDSALGTEVERAIAEVWGDQR